MRRGRWTLALTLALAPGLAACDDGRERLVVYSPHGRELLEVYERWFEELHPEVDVQWLDMGSQEVLDRLRSERANPQADVWWGAPAEMFRAAEAEALLAPSEPAWAAQVGEHRSAGGYWWATYLTPEVIAFNSDAVSAAEAPRDWDDVLDERWRGQVLIRDPLASGTMRTIFGMIVDRSVRETGDTAAGFDWLRRLDRQTKEYVLNPTMLYQKLARQEGLVTLWDMPDIEMLRARRGYPIDYVFPTSGTPIVVDAVALVAGGRNPERAAQFLEFVGSREAVLRAAREFHRLPARDDIPPDSLPERLRAAKAQIVPEPMDWERLGAHISDWMRHWDRHVRGRGGR
jgi:iron(III) transport system substrate-binding protein